MGRKKKAVVADPLLALWPCGRGDHPGCTGGPVMCQPAEATAGKVKAGSKNQQKNYPLVRDFVCPCECHRRIAS